MSYAFESAYSISSLVELAIYCSLALKASQPPATLDLSAAPVGFEAKPQLPNEAVRLIGTHLTQGRGQVLVLEGEVEHGDQRVCGVLFSGGDKDGILLLHIFSPAQRHEGPRSSIGLSLKNGVEFTFAGEPLERSGIIFLKDAADALATWRAN